MTVRAVSPLVRKPTAGLTFYESREKISADFAARKARRRQEQRIQILNERTAS